MAADAGMQLTPDLLLSVIKWLCGVIGSIIALFIVVIGILHRSMIRRLDLIEVDIKTLPTQIAIHTEQIRDIKEAQAESSKWLNNHDTRIQGLERQVASIK